MLAGRLCLRRVVERAQHRIAVAHRVLKIILIDFQVTGDGPEDLQPGAVERREQLEEGILEARHLSRPQIVRHMVAKTVAGRQIAADVPEFLEVVRPAALGGLNAERCVTARAAAAGDDVFALHFLRQREEGLRFLLGLGDQRLRNAVLGDDREAIFLEAAPELLSESIGISVGLLQ